MKKRHIAAYVAHLLTVEPWTGPVERRDPDVVRQRSIHLTWRCSQCRSWTMNGAYTVGRCNFCGAPRA